MSARSGGLNPKAFDILMKGVDANGGMGRPMTRGWSADAEPVGLIGVGLIAADDVEDGEAVELVDWTVVAGEVVGAVVHVARATAASVTETARVTAGRFMRRIVRRHVTMYSPLFLWGH